MPDHATLFEVCFTVIGAAGTASPFNFGNYPLAIEFVDLVDLLPNTVSSGGVHVVGPQNCSSALACNNLINLAADANCLANISVSDLLEGNFSGCDYQILVNDAAGDYVGSQISQFPFYFPALPIEGQTLTYFVTSLGSGNTCFGSLVVEDNTPPTLVCPADRTIFCENFDPATDPHEPLLSVSDNCCLDFNNLIRIQNNAQFQEDCRQGILITRWRADDCHGNSATCSQKITVIPDTEFFVKFPDDVFDLVCDGTNNYGSPTFFGDNCELIGMASEDVIFDVVPDACFKILRKWKIINWCSYDPTAPVIQIPNPSLQLGGPTVSAPGTVGAWASTVVALMPGQLPTDFSSFWSANPTGGYEYTQVIKVIDNDPPVIAISNIGGCDYSDNDPDFWNNPAFAGPSGMDDQPETKVVLRIYPTDLCTEISTVRAILFLDTDRDGVMETTLNSQNLPTTPGLLPSGVPFDNSGTFRFVLTFIAGVVARFDWLNTMTGEIARAQLPYGNHKIKWIVEDKCGNEATSERAFEIKNCRPPEIVCVNALSVTLTDPAVSSRWIWATDFMESVDDPTAQISICLAGTSADFPTDANGDPIPGLTFDCSMNSPIFVDVWARNAAGFASFCTSQLFLNCPCEEQPDTDTDGFCDLVDNCPTVSNPTQTDFDNDGIGDLCDDDDDNDGWLDPQDCQPMNAAVNPGMAEIFNCLDDNCNGNADEGLVTFSMPTTVFCTNDPDFPLTGGLPVGGNFGWFYGGPGVLNGSVFSPATAGAGAHLLTYTVTDENSCVNVAAVAIQVNAAPVVSLAAFSTVCLPATAFSLAGGSPTGGTFSGPGVSGGIFTPAAAGAGSHQISYLFTAANGCSAIATQALIVYPVTVGGSVSPAQTICSGASPFNLTLQNQVGAVVKWQSSPNGAAPWTDISSTSNPFSPGSLTATTWFRAVVQSGNCLVLNSASTKITVNAVPTVSFSVPSPVCQNALPVALVGSPTGGLWSGPGVSGSAFNPNLAGPGTHTIIYTKTVGGCTGTTSRTITVNALPTVSQANFAAVCLNSAPFSLSGGLPAGGVYAGAGVSGGSLFSPATAGVGTHSISYTVTDGATGCTKSTSKTLKVNALPTVSLASISGVCSTTPPFSLSGGSPAGGVFAGPGVSAGGIFTASMAGAGTHLISYTVTNSTTGCTKSATQTIGVNGSCSASCTILTCPPGRDLPLSPSSVVAANSCKITIPNLLPEVVLAGDCQVPIFSKTQNPAALSKVSAAHNQPVNVLITVIDLAGNTVTCTVILTAKDVNGPTFSAANCPAVPPATLPTATMNGCKAILPNLAGLYLPSTTDCSAIQSMVQSPLPGAPGVPAVHGQVIPITITATDIWGNQTVCVRHYKAKDATAPAATCPANQTMPLDGNCQFVVPDFTGLTATDCTAPISKTQLPAAGTVVTSTNGQVHAVVLTITDGAIPTTPNNSKICTINLTGAGVSCLVGGGGNASKLTNSRPQALTNSDFQAMPNPFSDELTVVFDLETAGHTRLVLLDLTGQFQFLETENWLDAGRQKVILNTEDLPAGAFFVGLKTAESAGWIWRKVMLVR